MMKLTIHGYKDIIHNKYFVLYNNIVINRINNPVDQITNYTEAHHILPKSCGGNNDSDNIVNLLAREHYICHYLLTKFTINSSYFKMITAFMAMNMKSQYTLKRTINSRLYAAAKIIYIKLLSEEMKIRWKDPVYRQTITAATKNSWHDGTRDDQLKQMKENSPFKNPETHKKTIETRTRNGTNVWITNNPMKDPERAKEIAQSRSGKNHYLTKNRLYYYKTENDSDWRLIEPGLTIPQICEKYGWTVATFRYVFGGKIPKRGPMKGISIKRVVLN